MNAAQDGSDAAAQGRLVKAGELARRTGLTRQALHVYVQMGLLEPAGTTQGGQRLFDEAAEGRVRLIRKLCSTGYTLKDIREIFLKSR
ncbi:MAG: MerR family transcriptional regulator [Planctomycetota bacterium]|nr:MerR family transcriptional regulator [Planctomycetota bacterium]